jgi:hypothetical protein
MSLTEETLQPIFTDINPNNKTVSIAMDTVIKRDGVEISKSRDRRAFVPGDIDVVKEYTGLTTGPEISYLEALWTAEVIAEYEASIVQQ